MVAAVVVVVAGDEDMERRGCGCGTTEIDLDARLGLSGPMMGLVDLNTKEGLAWLRGRIVVVSGLLLLLLLLLQMGGKGYSRRVLGMEMVLLLGLLAGVGKKKGCKKSAVSAMALALFPKVFSRMKGKGSSSSSNNRKGLCC